MLLSYKRSCNDRRKQRCWGKVNHDSRTWLMGRSSPAAFEKKNVLNMDMLKKSSVSLPFAFLCEFAGKNE
jgi:hypothetical protein